MLNEVKKIAIGTIAYRNLDSGEFTYSKSLFMPISVELKARHDLQCSQLKYLLIDWLNSKNIITKGIDNYD